ncbi:MAG: glycosyltransferase [Porphyromonas sp.]|nr:glycosyltransferase [Porphyromonas sp.]
MVPKIIHYCWFGPKPFPPLAERCLKSWQRYMPAYELKLWTEKTFDISCTPFVQEAYHHGKYAFVSDYARLWALHEYGGVYLDTDVELIRSVDDLCVQGGWMGREKPGREQPNRYPVALGLGFALPKGHPWLRLLLDKYEQMKFPDPNDKGSVITIVRVVTDLLEEKGLKMDDIYQLLEDVHIYPTEYFCPKSYYTGLSRITDRTYSIHHYDASWMSSGQKFKDRLTHLLGPIGKGLIDIKKRLVGKKFR